VLGALRCGASHVAAVCSAVLCLTFSVSLACRTSNANYRVLLLNSRPFLFPPHSRQDMSKGVHIVTTAVPRQFSACGSIEGVRLGLQGGRTLTAAIQPSAVADHQPGWLREYAAQLERQGCLDPGEGFNVAQRIVDVLPVEIAKSASALDASPRLQGVFDLDPGVLLRVVEPLFDSSNETKSHRSDRRTAESTSELTGIGVLEVRAPADLIGYRTSTYVLTNRLDGHGGLFAGVSSDTRLFQSASTSGGGQARLRPSIESLPANFCYFRLLQMTRRTLGSDRDQMLLAAPSLPDLLELAASIARNPDRCDQLGSGGGCILAMEGTAFVPLIRVQVNGSAREYALPVTLREVLSSVKDVDAAMKSLRVLRPYKGHPVPVAFRSAPNGILSLPLIGGEEISW